MNCREWEEAIALYAGGDLDARQSAEVEHHLAECGGCQIFACGMLESMEAMRAIHRQEIGEGHFAAVRARVLAKLRPLPRWRRRWLPAAAVAAMAGFAVWLGLLDRSMRRPAPPLQVALVRPPAPPRELLNEAHPARVPSRNSSIRRPHPKPAPPEEPLIVRIVTDNPDVVIYWIANPKGE